MKTATLRRKAIRAYGEYLSFAAWLAEVKGGHDTEAEASEVAPMVKRFKHLADDARDAYLDRVLEEGDP